MRNNVQHFFELLFVMVEKELRARYKHTIFGFFWLILNPILQMIVIGFIFTFFMKEPIIHYYYYLFIGLLVWNFFSVSLTKATPSIVFERSLIKKAVFPREVIPLSIILSNAVHFFIALVLYTIPIICIGTMTPQSLMYIASGLVFLFVFTVGISLLTTALNVRFRDINFFVQALLVIWFYATPIVYSLSIIPQNYVWLWRLNPLTSPLQLLQHGFVGSPPPDIYTLFINIMATVGICATGILVFKKESKNFDDWV